MTRATWCAAVSDRGRGYQGIHRAETRRTSRRFGRGLRIAVAVSVVYWSAVIAAAVWAGWGPALATAVVPLATAVMVVLALPSGWWRR